MAHQATGTASTIAMLELQQICRQQGHDMGDTGAQYFADPYFTYSFLGGVNDQSQQAEATDQYREAGGNAEKAL